MPIITGSGITNPITTAVTIAPTDPAPAVNHFFGITAPVGTQADGPYLIEVKDEAGGDQLTLDAYGTLTIDAPTGVGNAGAVTVAQQAAGGGQVLLRTVPVANGGNIAVVGASAQSEPLVHAKSNDGTSQLAIYPDGKILANLPSADPHVVGQLWNSAGTVHVSAG